MEGDVTKTALRLERRTNLKSRPTTSSEPLSKLLQLWVSVFSSLKRGHDLHPVVAVSTEYVMILLVSVSHVRKGLADACLCTCRRLHSFTPSFLREIKVEGAERNLGLCWTVGDGLCQDLHRGIKKEAGR